MKICTLTVLLKSGLSRFTSPVKIVFAWNIVLSSQCQIFIKKLSEIKVTKKDVKNVLMFHVSFKIFFQHYSLSIINAHRSLAKMLWGREWGLGESSWFCALRGRVAGDWRGWWQLLKRKISKFLTLFIAQISWFTLENLVILKKRSKFQNFLEKIKKKLPATSKIFQFFSFLKLRNASFFNNLIGGSLGLFLEGGEHPTIPTTRQNPDL